MLRAAAAFLGLALIWLLLAQRVRSLGDIALAGGVAMSALLLGLHFSGGVAAGFGRAPHLFGLGLSRVQTVLTGVASTTRAALAGDIKLAPTLVRLKTRGIDADVRADLATLIGTVPGNVVVETDVEGLLIHLIDEQEMDGGDLSGLEARVLQAHGLKVSP